MSLPTDPKARKDIPVYSGFIKYFPRAICAVAELSRIGNDQHNPGQPVHWNRDKSGDEKDALMRHMMDDAMGVPEDTDKVLHATKMAWRAMANLERALEELTYTKAEKADDGWISNITGKQLVNGFVEVKLRNGLHSVADAKQFDWDVDEKEPTKYDIVKYRKIE